MEALLIEVKKKTPGVTFDKTNNKFEISGKSLPEDVMAFYDPVIEWINTYFEDPNEETVFDLDFHYHNTGTNKVILKMLLLLDGFYKEGKKIRINWHYEEDDHDLRDEGRDYADLVDVPFEFLPNDH